MKVNQTPEELHETVKKQVEVFDKERDNFAALKDVIIKTLEGAKSILPGSSIVHGRVKTTDSFAEKCIRKREKYDEPAWQLTDLCGVRVVVLSKDTIPHVRQFIEETFLISEIEDTSTRLQKMEFGYQSIHYIVSLDADKRDLYPSRGAKIPECLFELRSPEEAGKTKLAQGPMYKAEIQVRTFLQHAWSSAVHDSLYKTEMKSKPDDLERQSALIAALLEEGDNSIVQLMRGVDEYKSFYGAYMEKEEIQKEIDLQRIVLANDQKNEKAALKIARLADSLGDQSQLEAVEKDLTQFEDGQNAAILRELGIVRWKLGQKEKGREILHKSVKLNPDDPDTLCELGLTYFHEKNYWDALPFYEKAFNVAPNYPRVLLRFIECTILEGKDNSFGFIPLIRQNLQSAIDSSRQKIKAGVHVPHAWYDIGFFNLLLGQHTESLESYGNAILTTASADMVEAVYHSLTEMHKKVAGKANKLEEGLNLIRSFLRVVLVGRYDKSKEQYLLSCDERLDGFASLSPSKNNGQSNPFKADDTIIIVAGSCSEASRDKVIPFEDLFAQAFKGVEGMICSGGTASGVSGIIGRLENNNEKLKKIAYVPVGTQCVDGYYCVQTIPGTFSRLEPIMLWSDLLLSGITPNSVRILGLRGGDISAFEYQLGLILGARVGVLPASGGASARISGDLEWSSMSTVDEEKKRSLLLRLPADVESLRAFLNPAKPSSMIDAETREQLAAEMHEEYSHQTREDLYKDFAKAAPWQELSETFKASSLGQIDHIEEKLKRLNLKLVKTDKPVLYTFSNEQLLELAEMEHGRWVVDRLEDGWCLGERNDEEKTRPQLIPWSQLDQSEKDKDILFIEELPVKLAKAGYEIK